MSRISIIKMISHSMSYKMCLTHIWYQQCTCNTSHK